MAKSQWPVVMDKLSSSVYGSAAKFLKEGRNHGFDPSFRKLSIKSLISSSCIEAFSKS
jgi:hypothetical protein